MLLVDHDKIFIKDYVEILKMDQYYFEIRMYKYSLHVRGEKLHMSYYDQNEIHILGKVKVIEYDQDRI